MDHWFKVNVDGATFAQSQTVGVGVLICDFASRVEAALSKRLFVPLGPLETEAKAMEEGIMFGWDVGVRDVVVESDSQIVISTLLGSSEPPIGIATIFEGIHQNLQDFRQVQFSSVKRCGNRLAHILAQYVKNNVSYVIWIEENLSMIESALTRNVLVLSSFNKVTIFSLTKKNLYSFLTIIQRKEIFYLKVYLLFRKKKTQRTIKMILEIP